MNHPVGRILHALFFHQKLFIKFLARPQPREFDLDIFSHTETGELDQILRQRQNLHRLSHIQHEDLTALSVSPRLQNQRNSLRDRHKITYDIRMRYRNRAAGCNLPAKQRNHAAVAAEHVPETHRHKFRIIMLVKSLDDHLTDPLAGPHDIGRIHRLIRGDHDEPLHTAHRRRLGRLKGAEHIVLDCFAGTVLH